VELEQHEHHVDSHLRVLCAASHSLITTSYQGNNICVLAAYCHSHGVRAPGIICRSHSPHQQHQGRSFSWAHSLDSNATNIFVLCQCGYYRCLKPSSPLLAVRAYPRLTPWLLSDRLVLLGVA